MIILSFVFPPFFTLRSSCCKHFLVVRLVVCPRPASVARAHILPCVSLSLALCLAALLVRPHSRERQGEIPARARRGLRPVIDWRLARILPLRRQDGDPEFFFRSFFWRISSSSSSSSSSLSPPAWILVSSSWIRSGSRWRWLVPQPSYPDIAAQTQTDSQSDTVSRRVTNSHKQTTRRTARWFPFRARYVCRLPVSHPPPHPVLSFRHLVVIPITPTRTRLQPRCLVTPPPLVLICSSSSNTRRSPPVHASLPTPP